MIAIIITLNVISNLASMASKISIEKDWIIVIAQHEYDKAEELVSSTKTDEEKNAEFKKKLALMNATVRRIDLSTNVVSPLVAGLIMSFLSFSKSIDGTVLSAIFFAVWNIMSLIAEYSLLSSVYNNVPGLEKSKIERNIEKKKSNVFVKMKKSVKNIHKGWLVYFRQGIVLMPSLSLSLLFLTVLSFDGITIGFAKSQKLSEFLISLIQAVGSLSGILGTLAYPLFHNKLKINLQLIGVIGSVFQLIFLFICLVSIWLPGSPFILADKLFSTRIDKCSLNQSLLLNSTSFSVDPSSNLKSKFFESPCLVYTSILVLLGAMALSRFGLWITDLVIHQIIQESVDEKERGVIGGVQSSINRIFDLLKFIFVIIFSDVTQYGYLVIISVVGVIFSFILYTVYAIREVYVKRYSKVPVDEIQPKIRKSMIKFNPRTSNEIEYDSDDSFDNEVRYINEDEKEAAS